MREVTTPEARSLLSRLLSHRSVDPEWLDATARVSNESQLPNFEVVCTLVVKLDDLTFLRFN